MLKYERFSKYKLTELKKVTGVLKVQHQVFNVLINKNLDLLKRIIFYLAANITSSIITCYIWPLVLKLRFDNICRFNVF